MNINMDENTTVSSVPSEESEQYAAKLASFEKAMEKTDSQAAYLNNLWAGE